MAVDHPGIGRSERSPTMIAPLRETESEAPRTRRRLRHAHQVLASTLLETRGAAARNSPTVPGWQAWLFAGWVMVATGFYFAHMIGWL